MSGVLVAAWIEMFMPLAVRVVFADTGQGAFTVTAHGFEVSEVGASARSANLSGNSRNALDCLRSASVGLVSQSRSQTRGFQVLRVIGCLGQRKQIGALRHQLPLVTFGQRIALTNTGQGLLSNAENLGQCHVRGDAERRLRLGFGDGHV